jgi:hypothetical protein
VRFNNGWLSVTGWVWDRQDRHAPRDLVFADASGLAIGLARSGLRRPDLSGKIEAAYLDEGGWKGYVTDPGVAPIEVYGVLGDSGHYCRIGEIPSTR